MPSDEQLAFLRKFAHKWITMVICVNALSRAITISTVHSGNPLFTRLSRYVFVSNSQNILEISFFGLFFWLV